MRTLFPVLIPFVALAEGDAFFDDTPGEEDPAPAVAVPGPFSEWDGVTQLFPAPHAKSKSHAESAESAELNLDLELVDTGGQLEFVDNPTIPSLSLVGEFELDKDAPEGLSGIAWTSNPGHPQHAGFPFAHSEESFDICGPDSYALCEDSGGWIHYAEIGVDRGSGAVTSAVFRARERLVGVNESSDLEAIAYARSRWNLTHLQMYASDEHHRCIAQDRPLAITSPSPAVALSLPEPLRAHRPNKGVEAMCLSPDDQALWLANEDALPEDGPVATTEHGALVQLWRMDAIAGTSEAGLRRRRAQGGAGPVEPAWWFYELDPAAGGKMPHLPDPFNGLAELCALPDGRLLALERTYGLRTRSADDPRASLITISIYLVDPLHAENAGSSTGPLREGAAERSEAGGVLRAESGAVSKPHGILPPAATAATPLSEGGESGRQAPSAARTAAAERPPVLAKTLLWKGLTGRANYEGMTLGPELSDGSRALLLVSDGDVTRKGAFSFPWSKRLLSFRLVLPAVR